MRVAVIGGHGFLGRHVIAALERAGVPALAAGRRGALRVDLTRPESFDALRACDLVIDCGDSVAAPPDALIAWCLAEGVTLVETAAEPLLTERVLRAHRDAGPPARGTVLLGAGIFPGISNLLAASAARAAGACRQLSLGIRWSTLSAGGAGMVRLVPHLVRVPTRRYRDGVAIEGAPVEPGPTLPFPSGDARTLALPFSEASLLARSTGVPEIAVYAAPQPRALGPLFRLTPPWLLGLWPVRIALGLLFTLLRRLLLARRSTPVELVAVAEGGRRCVLGACTRDGIAHAGADIAAMALALTERPCSGLAMPEELFELDAIVERANALCDPDARLLLSPRA